MMFDRLLKRCKATKEDKEFQKTMDALSGISYEELDRMHEVLLDYVLEYPITIAALPPEELLRREREFANRPIENGGVFGCKTYGQAIRMNCEIVKILDALEK